MKKNKKTIISFLAASASLSLFVLFTGLSTLAAGPASVNLGSSANFAILAKSGISTTGSTSITGNIGVSPIAASAITGFGLAIDNTNTFSTSPLVSGKVYAADYMAPTPATMSAAIGDMQTAYTDAAGRLNPLATELGSGNIGGMTLAPGLYKWSTGVTIPTNVTLSGGASDIWIFQIAQNLTVSSAVHVILSGGAQASNVFWQVAGQTTIGTTAVFNGNILDQTAIVLQTGASLNGRALAQTAVTLDSNGVMIPVAVAVVAPTPTSTPVIVASSTVVVNGGANGSNGSNVPVTTSVSSLLCSPTTQNVTLGNAINVSATGGDGNYVWSAPDVSIENPNGPGFSASYASVGLKTLTVKSAGLVATCTINVQSNNVVVPPVVIPSFPNTGGGFGQ